MQRQYEGRSGRMWSLTPVQDRQGWEEWFPQEKLKCSGWKKGKHIKQVKTSDSHHHIPQKLTIPRELIKHQRGTASGDSLWKFRDSTETSCVPSGIGPRPTGYPYGKK